MLARKAVLLATVIIAAALLATEISFGDWEPPPPPKPGRLKAAEGFPPGPGPLPGPVTPIRRTEKKREPAKPALIGKIQYGNEKWVTTDDGRRFSILDWQSDTTDLYLLLNFTNAKLGLNYRYIETTLASFTWNPAELPVLYFTGHDDFIFTDLELQSLGWYLRDGGTLIGDACCGASNFAAAFTRNIKLIFPDRPFREIAPDDPIYHCYLDVDEVAYQEEGKQPAKTRPNLRGMYLGCRIAVILSTHDMSCGWARHEHPQGKRIAAEDANRIGLNLITYVLANYQYAKSCSLQKVYHAEEGEQRPRDQFIFGQVVHGGDWDPNPTAVPNLLKHLAANSTIDVPFRLEACGVRLAAEDSDSGPKPQASSPKPDPASLQPGQSGAFRYPFIYMTGHEDFELTEQEVAGLRGYLANGGVLLANACCGRQAFDTAFRRELRKVCVDQPLHALPPDHPLFFSLYSIKRVDFTPWLKELSPKLDVPQLEGISLGGQLAVVYSKYDLGSGWEAINHPYSLGYTSEDAMKIGANVVVYAMTH